MEMPSLTFVKVSIGRHMWLERSASSMYFGLKEETFVTKYDPIVYLSCYIQGEQFSTKIEKNNEPRGVSCDFAVFVWTCRIKIDLNCV